MGEMPQANLYNLANVDASVIQQKEKSDFNKYMQDMQKVIGDLDMFFSGYQLNKDVITGEITITLIQGKKMMNEKGREAVKSRLNTYLNPNLYLSALSEPDAIRSFQIDIANFACDFAESLVEYECDLKSFQKVVSIIAPVIWFALRKAQTDKEAIYEGMRSTNVQPMQNWNPLGGVPQQRQGGY